MTLKPFLFTCLMAFSLTGCIHYNYGVKKKGSSIPFENLYSGDDNDTYEFYSTLFKYDEAHLYLNYVEITHLSDVYNHDVSSPNETWKQSLLNFELIEKTGVELIPSSVKLQHFTQEGKLIKPFKVFSTLESCVGKQRCRGYLKLYYKKGIPPKVIEKVSFELIKNGKKQKIAYTVPLDYKFEYTFWDQLMGI